MIALKEGKKLSEETIAKISASIKGMKKSEEHKAKVKATMKGMKKSEEHKAKIKVALKGLKKSEETKAKMSAAHMGNKNGPGYHGKIEVFYQETGLKTIYPSMSEVSKILAIPKSSISLYFSRNTRKPYKGRYVIKKIS